MKKGKKISTDQLALMIQNQFLDHKENVATKADLFALEDRITENMATKDDLNLLEIKLTEKMVTKEDFGLIQKSMATKDDLKLVQESMATKEDVKNVASKKDIQEIKDILLISHESRIQKLESVMGIPKTA